MPPSRASNWKATVAILSKGIKDFQDSVLKPSYLKAVRKYCPSVNLGDLRPHPAGVRAQAVLRDGTPVTERWFRTFHSQSRTAVCTSAIHHCLLPRLLYRSGATFARTYLRIPTHEYRLRRTTSIGTIFRIKLRLAHLLAYAAPHARIREYLEEPVKALL